jgi:putative sterol carrier protein
LFSLRKLAAAAAVYSLMAYSGAGFAQQNEEAEKQPQAEASEEKAEGQQPTTATGDLEPLMSVEYIKQFCDAWNADELMTTGLANSEWVDNDGDKGFKIIQLYRRDCPDSPRVEMQFERADDKAMCVYAGKVENPDLDRSADYEMFADTKRWIEVGNGDYGPMKAMMLGRLKFKGPKIEAMGNMGPFKNFLLLFGKFPADPTTCP